MNATPEVQRALQITYTGNNSIGVESFSSFNSSLPIEITLSLPKGQLQYIELDYTNSSIAIDNSFSQTKGEIANNGNGDVLVTGGMDGNLAKVSAVG